jgi:hypothetical protein
MPFCLSSIAFTNSVLFTTGSFQVLELIDIATPFPKIRTCFENQPYELAFIYDGFEIAIGDYTLYPGDDPYWEAVETGKALRMWYNPKQITTKRGRETEHFDGGCC